MARHSAPRRARAPRQATAPRSAAGPAVLVATAVVVGGVAVDEYLPVGAAGSASSAFDTALVASSPATGWAGTPAFSPVAPAGSLPDGFDAAALVKAVTLTDRQAAEARRRAEDAAREIKRRTVVPPAIERPTTVCTAGTDGFGAVRSWVATAGVELRCRFGVDTVYGVAGRAGASDHPSGLALDFMVDRDPGDRLAEYAVANMDRLGISYVIYRQRINTGSGWRPMEDRGSATANHFDHVHVSFRDR